MVEQQSHSIQPKWWYSDGHKSVCTMCGVRVNQPPTTTTSTQYIANDVLLERGNWCFNDDDDDDVDDDDEEKMKPHSFYN